MWWSAMPGPDAPLGLGEARAIHIVGVGGAGMSAIASVLAAMGHVVTGSDLKASPVTERLVAQGIPVAIGHAAANVAGADLVTASPAVAPDNVELDAARRRGIVVVRRAEMLAAITATRRTVAVAGTHGKTTTSSMLALILVEAGLAPSFLIGADVGQIGANAVWDSGDLLVVEADESYGTFEVLEPALAVVTNIEADHLDHYGTFETLEAAFEALVARAPLGSVVGADDPSAARVGARHGAISVGLDSSATYVMEDVELGRSAVAFDLVGPGGRLGRLSVPVPGLHNARNAAVAAVAALQVGAPFEAAAAALARFPGASSSGASATVSPSSTTTPTCRARCVPRWRPRARATGGGLWPSSSHTATRALPPSPTRSPAPSPTPTWWSSPTSTAPASRLSRASRAHSWSRRCGRRAPGRGSSTPRRAATWWRSSPASCVTATCA